MTKSKRLALIIEIDIDEIVDASGWGSIVQAEDIVDTLFLAFDPEADTSWRRNILNAIGFKIAEQIGVKNYPNWRSP